MKKLITVILAVLCCMLLVCAVCAEEPEEGIDTLKINPYGGEETAIDTICWHRSGDTVFLFLPADTDPALAVVYFSADGEVTLDGEALTSGGSAAAFTPGSHVLACGEQSWELTVCVSANLPAVFLTTASGSLDYIHDDKENKEPGCIRIYENGVMTLDKDLKQIKGRGNATWFYAKKPYNIKFDKKTDLFGMGKAKKWTLLANFIDLSLLHNAYAWEFASALGLPNTGEYRHVDLYINGSYLGNYVICESVEIAENRIDIPDLEKANEKANPGTDIEALPRGGTGPDNTVQSGSVKGSRKWIEIPADPEDITGGYLLEYEYAPRYNQELCGFVTENGQPIVIKSPEYASKAEVDYIADFMEAGTQALYSTTGCNAEGRHYSEYFDVDSLAEAYILQELSMNYDAAFSSFFAYKPAGEDAKIVFSPVWDMDNAFGSPYANLNVPPLTTDLWWASQMAYNGIPTVLAAACRHEEFRALVREKWAQMTENGGFEAVDGRIFALTETLRQSAVMNGLRWNFYGTLDPAAAAEAWQEQTEISMGFVSDRVAALSRGLGPDGAYLYYDLNGVTAGSWATVCPVCAVGDTVTVRDVYGNGSFTVPAGKTFRGWALTPDGSGLRYQPGDTLLLEGECTVLYAVWRTQKEIDMENGVLPFVDVSREDWFFAPVLWAFYHEPPVTSGTDATHFSPGKTCTREQIVTFLWAASGKPEPASSDCPFTDVVPGSWYEKAVLWAYENGVTSGMNAVTFGVGKPCTREQVVTFLWKAAGAPEPAAADCPFADVVPGSWYEKAVLWAYENGVTSGMNAVTFGVGKSCTRAQAVTFLYAALDRKD